MLTSSPTNTVFSAESQTENAKTSEEVPTLFAHAAYKAIRGGYDEIVRNWDGALSGIDVEAIHDLRVATRRLRAALSVYEEVFPAVEFRRIERTVSRLTDHLGPARDSDVLIEYLQDERGRLDTSRTAEVVGIDHYIHSLQQIRIAQQVELIAAMRKIDLDGLCEHIETIKHIDSGSVDVQDG